MLSQGTFCRDWHIRFLAKRLNMHFSICPSATDLTSDSTSGPGGSDIDCMESGKQGQLFSAKPLYDK